MTEGELLVARMVFFGSVIAAVLLVHGAVRLGCYIYKALTRRQDSPALVTWEDEA